jgi:TolB-like protein/DNA-binding winged helix-turn-helix (wHTH) protein
VGSAAVAKFGFLKSYLNAWEVERNSGGNRLRLRRLTSQDNGKTLDSLVLNSRQLRQPAVDKALQNDQVVRFATFDADLRAGELRKSGLKLKLSGQPFQVLAILLERPGEVVTRDELQKRLWPDTFVDVDHNLNSAINKIRETLGDSAENPRFVETLARRGYRFIAPVNGWYQNRVLEAKPTRGSRSLVFLVAFGLLAVIGATAVLFVLNVDGWRGRLSVHAAKPRIQSLAVLPLANLSGDPGQEYFAQGMTEALITELGKTSIPRVISRQSVLQYEGSKKPVQEIARELNVDAVLEGTIVRSGDRVRVTVHLDRASPEAQLWASAYDRSVRDVLGLQNEIARTITDEIQVKLTPQERARLANARPIDPEAHDEYLRAHYILGMVAAQCILNRLTDKRQYTDADTLEAIGHFKHAIEIDPAYAMAYAGLADAHISLGNPTEGGHSSKETLSDAKEAATKALELDPSLAEAHFSLAQTLEYEWNWSEAEKEFKLALELNPNYADAHLEYGRFLQAIGRNDEAITHVNYALELDPSDFKTKDHAEYVTWASGQYDIAIKQFENLGDDFGLAWSYRQKKMYPQAIAAGQRSVNRSRREPVTLGSLACAYGLAGKNREALELINELKERDRQGHISSFVFAEAYLGLGERDQALTRLERAYEDRDEQLVYINSDPRWDPLRSAPRFQALLGRMNFPQ